MNAEEEVIRGGSAREVLDSTVFNEAKKHVVDGINYQMSKCPIHDQTMHTRLIMMLQLWQVLEGYLQQVADSGRMADFQLAQQEEQRKRFKLFG